MLLILRVDKLNTVKWWVEASYTMHIYFRSHTGAMIYIEWVSFAIMSKRKKLN